MKASVNIHACCVAMNGKGVLLLGASGAGKSDLALRLIDGGAKLVADDRCELFARRKQLCARPPASIAGLMEIRGIGIVKLAHVKSAPIALAVKLGRSATRLPRPAFYAPPRPFAAMRQVPLIVVNGASASAPARIRAVLAAFSRGTFRDTFNLE